MNARHARQYGATLPPSTARLSFVQGTCPKKAGTLAASLWSAYTVGATLADVLAALKALGAADGRAAADVRWNVQRGYCTFAPVAALVAAPVVAPVAAPSPRPSPILRVWARSVAS